MRKSTVKKTASKAPVVKEEITKTESTVSVKAETAEPEKKEETNAIVKQEAGTVVPVEKKETAVEKKAPAKKETKAAKEEEKPAVKKAPAKRKASAEKPAAEKKAPARRTAKAAEVKAELEIQFSGKEYSMEKLVAIAKDVWQYDLGGKPEDFKTVKLYVKPEENAVYYVINGEKKGSFAI